MASCAEREAFWRKVIEQREALQLTIDEVCERAGVSRASFYVWQRRLREADLQREAIATRPSPLVPVKIVDDRVVSITIELPGDICVRVPQGCDQQTLACVLQLLLAPTRLAPTRGEA